MVIPTTYAHYPHSYLPNIKILPNSLKKAVFDLKTASNFLKYLENKYLHFKNCIGFNAAKRTPVKSGRKWKDFHKFAL